MPGRNAKPIEKFNELKNEINYSNFKYRTKFEHICTLYPDNSDKKIKPKGKVDDRLMKKKGLVYLVVISNKIFKIGETRNNIKNRISSFNCGSKKLMERGTPSTTNYFDLQSFLNIGREIKIYVVFAPRKKYKNFFLGEEYDFFPSPPEMKKRILASIEKIYKKKPIGNEKSKKNG